MQNEAEKDEEIVNDVESLQKVDDESQKHLPSEIPVEVETDYTRRVMEDLDALLANLQSTTASISSYQLNQPPQQQYYPGPSSTNYVQQYDQYDDQGYPPPASINPQQRTRQQQVDYNFSSGHSSYDRDQGLRQGSQQYQGTPQYPGAQQFQGTPQYPGAQQYQGPQYQDNRFQAPQGNGVVTVRRRSYNSSDEHSGGSTPPPLPPPPPSELLDSLAYPREEHPIYEQQTFVVREATPSSVRETTPSSVSDSSDQIIQQRAQVKGRGERMSALSNNLSELDQLLQDLNSAQFMAEVDRKSSNMKEVSIVNGGYEKQAPQVAPKPSGKPVQRTSVDNLLDQLEGVGPAPGRFPVDPHYQELSSVTTNHSHYLHGPTAVSYPASSSTSSTSSYQHPQTASTATKELDELMMSLSEFKLQNKTEVEEPAYAKPLKSRSLSSNSPTSPAAPLQLIPQERQQYHQQQQQNIQRENGQRENGQLESMLGDLQSDMNRQGVNIKQKGVCAACQKSIVGQVIAALGRTWHVEHFVCAHCEEPLGTRNFYERDGMAYCERDYHQLFAPRCAYCNGPIVDKCITALEKMWHPEHFFCAQCGRPFGEEDFHEKNGKAYCREDYFQMFAPKCGGCAQPIMENYISALNRQWHPECFVCWECRSTFGVGSFFDYEGLPYCEMHYHAKKGSLCASCEKPITGRCITAMFKKFHPEHFVCAFCLKQLNKGTFKEQNDKPYCHPCFVKLFG
ncbi:leupaxin-like isoform X3 [Physella acuta]|uniref:leupaxin-like isoform X3 n=1 Tax=Physella acuta TaxID=109671 RepID=UPI0027DDA381|nr:leupaxin-like isoform X3 [Physella acuta]